MRDTVHPRDHGLIGEGHSIVRDCIRRAHPCPYLDALAGDLDNYYPLHVARGEALRRLGRRDEARVAYERAAVLATSTTARDYFDLRLQELSSRGG